MPMRNLVHRLSFIILLALVGLSCHKDDGLAPGFDMVFQREFTIPVGIGQLDVHHFQLKNIPSNWQQSLDLHGKTAEEITGVITAQASIGGVYGDVDLSVVEKIFFRIYEESNPNDYVEIAYREPAPLNSGNILPLIPSLADSKRFFTNPRFSVDVVIYLRQITQDDSVVRLDLTMRATY